MQSTKFRPVVKGTMQSLFLPTKLSVEVYIIFIRLQSHNSFKLVLEKPFYLHHTRPNPGFVTV